MSVKNFETVETKPAEENTDFEGIENSINHRIERVKLKLRASAVKTKQDRRLLKLLLGKL